MIALQPGPGNIVKIGIVGKIDENDIRQIAAEADKLIREHGAIRLLADATEFDGWADMAAAEKHFTFVREHQKKVERIALIAGSAWQHWLVGMIRVFVHPEIRIFSDSEAAEAERWLME